jgi:glycosyltransferase involved in cell wall biosynthesis
MPLLTALLHTLNDALRLGRCLETLYPCDDIVIVDHGSHDGTTDVARDYGARVVQTAAPSHPLNIIREGWILCLDPRESVTESLAASLFEWKSHPEGTLATVPFSMFIREETPAGWIAHPMPQTRLVPRNWNRWHGNLPTRDASAQALDGELLRFAFP